MGTGNCSKAIIIGLDGTTWASTEGFSVKPNEAKRLIAAFGDATPIYTSGLTLRGTMYMTIKADGRSIYGKKGATGFCAVKTRTCVVVGYYSEQIQPGNAANTIECLADYLLECDF